MSPAKQYDREQILHDQMKMQVQSLQTYIIIIINIVDKINNLIKIYVLPFTVCRWNIILYRPVLSLTPMEYLVLTTALKSLTLINVRWKTSLYIKKEATLANVQ